MSIRHWEDADRPRERLQRHGGPHLTTQELVAILLATGDRQGDAVRLAARCLAVTQGLAGLGGATMEQLCAIPGIGPAKAATLVAALELARRWQTAQLARPLQIETSGDLFTIYAPRLRGRPTEHLCIVSLDACNRVSGESMVTTGDPLSTVILPREIVATISAHRAVAFALLHNHPSGDVVPSEADRAVTRHLATIGEMIGIPLLDHLIVGTDHYYSFRDEGAL